jgi:hypothetical protein
VIKAAAQLGAMLAPMILQEVQAGGGGGEEEMAPQEAQPVFRKGGKFVDNSLSNFLKYTLKLVPSCLTMRQGSLYYHTNQHKLITWQTIQ